MKKVILVRYGEIILKGLNRPFFEGMLVKNIKKAISDEGNFKIHTSQATIYIEPDDDVYTDSVIEKLKKVFGVVSIVVSYETEKNSDAIFECIKDNFSPELSSASTFKVIAKRSDKKFFMKSPEIC